MKKTLFTLLICLLPIVGFGQSIFKRGIQVGTTDSVATVDSIVKYGAIFKMYEGATRLTESDVIGDSITQLKADALYLEDYVPLLVDSTVTYVTPTQMATYLGTGGGTAGKFYYLSGNVDGLGFPDAGDTSLTHTNFIGKHLTVIREGQVQQQHTNNTTQDGFWLNNTTGEIRFRPALGAGEQIEIWSTNTIQWESLTAEEGGGEAESTLLTGLIAGWQLNEVSGTTATDVLATYNGTTSGATVNQSGKFGTAYSFDGVNDYVTMGGTSALEMTGTFSLSCWIYTAGVAWQTFVSDYIGRSPYTYGWMLSLEPTGTLEAVIRTSDDSGLTLTSAGTANNSAWHNVILTYDVSTGAAYLYLDNAQVDTDTKAGTKTIWYHTLNEFRIGDRGEGDIPFSGRVDEVYLFNKVLSTQERLDLQTKVYPFN